MKIDFQIRRTGRIEPEECGNPHTRADSAENGGKDGTPSDGEPKWKAFSTLGMVGDEQDMRQYLIPAEEMVPDTSRVRWLLRYSEELERLILA